MGIQKSARRRYRAIRPCAGERNHSIFWFVSGRTVTHLCVVKIWSEEPENGKKPSGETERLISRRLPRFRGDCTIRRCVAPPNTRKSTQAEASGLPELLVLRNDKTEGFFHLHPRPPRGNPCKSLRVDLKWIVVSHFVPNHFPDFTPKTPSRLGSLRFLFLLSGSSLWTAFPFVLVVLKASFGLAPEGRTVHKTACGFKKSVGRFGIVPESATIQSSGLFRAGPFTKSHADKTSCWDPGWVQA